MTSPDVEAIVKRLTKAQRSYLTYQAENPGPWGTPDRAWFTYPPSNTHRVLMRIRLVSSSGAILPLGLAVRAHILSQEQSR